MFLDHYRLHNDGLECFGTEFGFCPWSGVILPSEQIRYWVITNFRTISRSKDKEVAESYHIKFLGHYTLHTDVFCAYNYHCDGLSTIGGYFTSISWIKYEAKIHFRASNRSKGQEVAES